MKLLFENWRNFKNEAQDPDSDSDDSAELKNMAPEINRAFIEKIIGDFSFNSGQSSQHRWSPRQPIIDYYFDKRNGGWKYTATIPDGTNNADKWPTINSNPKEDIGQFLARVENNPQQLNLFENWRKFVNEEKERNDKVNPDQAIADEGGALGFSKWEELTGMSREELEKYVKDNDNIQIHKHGDIIDKKGLNEDVDITEDVVVDEGKICAAGKEWAKDNYDKWPSAYASMGASKKCKELGHKKDESLQEAELDECWSTHERVPGTKEGAPGSCRKKRSAKKEGMEREEGDLKKWRDENWTQSDGTPCGDSKAQKNPKRCKPAAKWAGMSKGEKKADNAKKKAGGKKGKQFVSATKKGKVKGYSENMKTTKSQLKRIIQEEMKQLRLMDPATRGKRKVSGGVAFRGDVSPEEMKRVNRKMKINLMGYQAGLNGLEPSLHFRAPDAMKPEDRQAYFKGYKSGQEAARKGETDLTPYEAELAGLAEPGIGTRMGPYKDRYAAAPPEENELYATGKYSGARSGGEVDAFSNPRNPAYARPVNEMKITKSQLKRIIKEELENVLRESLVIEPPKRLPPAKMPQEKPRLEPWME